MEFRWGSHGVQLGFLWDSYGVPVGFVRGSCGIPWGSHGVQVGLPWGSGLLSAKGARTCPGLTIELLPEEGQEDSEVDGALPLLQHGVQLLLRHTHLPCEGGVERSTGTVVFQTRAGLPSRATLSW